MPSSHLPVIAFIVLATISFILLVQAAFQVSAQINHPWLEKSVQHLDSSTPDSKNVYPLIAVEPTLNNGDPMTPFSTVSSVMYGPFSIAPHDMRPQEILFDAQKPCSDCYILAMHATLQDTNGTEIFTDSGAWLHHIIFFNTGRPDLTCSRMAGERFYGGGNERWTRRWNSNGPWGYKIDKTDKWDIVVELMNDADVEKEVFIVVRFEWISATSVPGREYRGVAAVWLDVTGCGNADVDVKSTTEPFDYRTPDWTSSVNGVLVDVGGHMHDGGIDMTAFMNGREMCRSQQLYDNQAAEQHIVAVGVCKNAGKIRVGDVLWAEARYDPNLHRLITHNGKPDPVMGSMGVYIGLT